MSEKVKASFILASASPRRKELLEKAGFKFEVAVPEVDESSFYSTGIRAEEYAKRLALAKSKNIAGKFPDYFVIGADTVVDYKGEIIGKAGDEKHAEEIIQKLFSQSHKVITAVAIVKLSEGIEIVESDTTIVFPKKMSPSQITEHIKGGSWRDKAGAYAIQETGDEFVERIEGSLTNVMGLPMELLQRLLADIGISS
jgi:septum formation protein